MKLIVVVVVLAWASSTWAVEDSEVYADPMELSPVQKRAEGHDDTLKSIDKTLKHHSELLQKLKEMVQQNEELIKKVHDNTNIKENETEIHSKVKILHTNRRSNTETDEIPIVKFGKDINSRDIIRDDKQNSGGIEGKSEENYTENKINTSSDTGRKDTIDNESEHSERRNNDNGYNNDINSGNSPWCEIAAKCTKELHMDPVCGYDDIFGFAKFSSTCHLFKVNCYWNYNFTLVLCR